MKKLFGFLMVGLAFTALQVAMVADAHAFSTQDMGVGLKFKDLADTVVPVTANPAVKEMEHKVQCAKIEDSDERTNCLQEIPTSQEREQAHAAHSACILEARGAEAVEQCNSDMEETKVGIR